MTQETITLDGKTYTTKNDLEKMRSVIEGKKLIREIDVDNLNETIGDSEKEKKSFEAFKKYCDLIFTESYEGRGEWLDIAYSEVVKVISFFYKTLSFAPTQKPSE